MVRAYIGLGANLGNAPQTLAAATQQLDATPHCRIAATSMIWRSAPVAASGPDFFNAVVALETGLHPLPLLHVLRAIEAQHGRARPYPNAPRTLDLDLLLYGDVSLDTPELVIPHPRMHQRRFVLAPLAELAPTHAVGAHGTVVELLATTLDQPCEPQPQLALRSLRP